MQYTVRDQCLFEQAPLGRQSGSPIDDLMTMTGCSPTSRGLKSEIGFCPDSIGRVLAKLDI